MLNEQETELIIEVFFRECLAFWNRTIDDTRQAFKNAIRDISRMTNDPNEPHGKKIDIPTRDKYVKDRWIDLEIFEI